MNAPLDNIAFLASSANRVGVLETLADTPRSRDELMDDLDVSRATLARILHDLEARTWIGRTDQMYTVTPLGAMVAAAFTDLLDAMEAECQLRTVMSWFPTEHVPFDIQCLSEADIIVPSDTNITAHVQRGADLLRSAQRVRVLSAQTAPPIVEATATAVEEHGQRFEGVLTPGLVEMLLQDPAMAPLFVDLLDAPTVDVSTSEDEIPVMFFIADETVGLPLTDSEDIARGLVLSDDATVHDWAAETFEAFRARADPVDPEVFTV